MHFLKLCKNYISEEILTFIVFISLVAHILDFCTKTCMKIAFMQHLLPKIAFLDISSQNYAKTSQVFQNIAKLESMTMQMISDFMHFDTIVLRLKNAIWKKGRL